MADVLADNMPESCPKAAQFRSKRRCEMPSALASPKQVIAARPFHLPLARGINPNLASYFGNR